MRITMKITTNSEQVKRFFNALWPGQEDGFLSISSNGPSGLSSKFFKYPLGDAVLNTIERWSGRNVWFTIGLFGKRPEKGRGKAEDVTVSPGLGSDIDCLGGTHKEKNLPTKEQALSLLNEIPFKPSVLIWSGGGYQPYWLFSEPWIFEGPGDCEKSKELSRRWQSFLISRGKEHGWKIDNCGSIEHLFRVPGTFNHKAEPVPVEIVEMNDFRYSVEAFQEFLDDIPQDEAKSAGPDVGTGRIYEIVERCAFLRDCRDNASRLPEPSWWCMVCALCFEGGSGSAIHELSKNYPQYTQQETDQKILEALKQTGPITCKAIQETTSFECPSGGCGVSSPVHLGMKKNNTPYELNEQNEIKELENRIWEKWPSLGSEALTGFAGRFVELASRKSEADPAATLLTCLARFAVECGSVVFIYVGDAKHYVRVFVVIVGASSKSRKGTSSKPVKRLFRMGLLAADDIFIPARVSPGPLSSGEGLIYAVRDEVTAWKVDKKTGQGEEVVIDPGVADKRLFILDEEFSSALIAAKREGNTLSTILRSIWDSGNLEPLTKNNRIKSTGAHIGIVSHITLAELNRKLDEVEAFSGFANRILWVCARRQGVVPFPEPMPEKELASLQWELKGIIERVQKFSQMNFSEDAKEKWMEVYSDLSKDHSGLVGAVIDRAESQVIRLAMIYSLLDSSDIISVGHLESALAVWRYCEASAGFIFAGREVNPYSQKILDLLRKDGEKTATEIYEHFNRHIKKSQLEQSIMEMVSQKKIEIEKIQTKGRPRTVFRCCFNQRPCEESEESEERLDFSF